MTIRRRIKRCPQCGCGTRLSQSKCLQCGFDFIAAEHRHRRVTAAVFLLVMIASAMALVWEARILTR